MPDDVIRVSLGSPEEQQEAKAFARQYAQSNPGQEAPAASLFSPSGRAVGGVYAVSVGSQHYSPAGSGFSRVAASEIASETPGVLSTARNPKSFGPVSGDRITADSIVTVDGQQMSVGIAARLGYLRVNAGGRYEDISTSSNAATAQPTTDDQQQQAEQSEGDDKQAEGGDEIEPFGEDLENHIADFQKVGNVDFEAGMSQMIATGEMSDSTADSIANQLGMPPEQVRERATALRTAFEDQAKEMTGAGDVLPTILEQVMKTNPEAVNKAVDDHVKHGKRNAYDAVINQYIYDAPKFAAQELLDNPDAQRLGIRQERSGEITLDIPGVGRTTWQAAIRAGLIAPQFKRN